MANLTYSVALPFLHYEEGDLVGGAGAASLWRCGAEGLARDPKHVGALAFKRSGDPSLGD